MKITHGSRWLAAAIFAGACASATADDIYVANVADVSRYLPGMDVRYQVSVSARGILPARDVRLIDVFPSQCISVAWSCDDSQQPGSCTTRSGTGDIDTVVNVVPDRGVSFEAYCRLADPLAGPAPYVSTASAVAPEGSPDPTPFDNIAVAVLEDPLPGAYLHGSLSVAGDFRPGGLVTYTTVLTNIGPAAQNHPAEEYVDDLPYDVLANPTATATHGTATATDRSVSWNVSLAPGASATLTVTARIRPLATGTVRNQGRAYFDYLAEGYNRGIRLTDDPAAPGLHDSTDFVILGGAASAPIPALAPAGLLVLGAGLGWAAWRRSRAARGRTGLV